MSEVYFTDLRTSSKQNLLDKLSKLCDRLGFRDMIVDKVRAAGGKPFLTDANTLYAGSRANAADHLETAVQNGFDFAVVNAPLVIADGLTGKDYINVPIEGKHFKEVKIGSAACHANAIISITHFKGHELTGFGGVLKNLGMGLGCRKYTLVKV
ncbi:protein of unknown function [Desulfoscipio geothermicus DSM 3669]|uniref:DUF362 domain-containing protein n=1 Tax=Desulfoscipio geothermicus DSM 3669 TaxID=1121426 RepID=A0A1I6CUL6_9FIRM|nr:protein of unknown function [Desulfoscipio geothermicus DSM 3669]